MAVLAEIDEDDDSKIKITAEWRYNDLLKGLQGSKFKNNYWRLPYSWQMYLALGTTFNGDIEYGPVLTERLNKEYNEIIAPGYALREQLDGDGYSELYPHQRGGVQFLSKVERAFLCDGLGSGKTRTTLGTIRKLYEDGKNPFPVLVSCPNSTKYGWQREAETTWPGLKVVVVAGSAGQRRKILEEPAHIYIINHESVKSHSRLAPFGNIALKRCVECGGTDEKIKESTCQVHEKELNRIEFQTVIIDEVHRIKEPKSQISRALKAATGKARFRYGLSGTPIAATPQDLFSPLNWMMPEAYPSKTKFIERFMDVTYDAWGGAVVVGVKRPMESEFFGGIDPHLRRMPKEIILPFLPPVVRERRDVEMGGKQAKAYKQMKDQMIAELDGDLLVTTSGLTRMTRLLQFATSYAELVYDDKELDEYGNPKSRAVLTEPSATLDAFIDDLDDFEGESVVVFAVSSQLINLLSKRLDKLNIKHGLITGAQTPIERQIFMDDFQEGKIKFILCTTAAGGTGITLTKGSTCVFLQRPWSMIENEQAEGRIHRIGSEMHESVRIIDYVTSGTVQEAVFGAIEEKGRQLEFILRDKDLIRKTISGDEIKDADVTEEETKEENEDQ